MIPATEVTPKVIETVIAKAVQCNNHNYTSSVLRDILASIQNWNEGWTVGKKSIARELPAQKFFRYHPKTLRFNPQSTYIRSFVEYMVKHGNEFKKPLYDPYSVKETAVEVLKALDAWSTK